MSLVAVVVEMRKSHTSSYITSTVNNKLVLVLER